MNNNSKKYMVFTDLDGTLLDHDTYSFQEAEPALQRLKNLNIPLIPATSKTLAEVEVLLKEMEMLSPVIVENGGAIAIPANFDLYSNKHNEEAVKFDLIYLSKPYRVIIEVLNKIREKFDFQFRGFNDMSVSEIADVTGLSQSQAQNAKQRLCSEPIMWCDSEEKLTSFITVLQKFQFRVTRGGRFFHVMGEIDKSDAMEKVVKRYRQFSTEDFTIIVLGDSPNDISMLCAADIGVVIRKKDQSCLSIESDKQIYTTQLAGPAGWNEFFLWLLDENKTEKPGASNG